MRIYTVHERPAPAGADPDVVLVKEGISWLALLLPPLWCLWYRQWLGLAAYLIGALLIGLLVELLDGIAGSLLGFCYTVLVGVSANDWRRARLEVQGYRLQRVVGAASLAEAETRYFQERASREPRAPAPSRPAPSLPAYRRREPAAPLAPWSP